MMMNMMQRYEATSNPNNNGNNNVNNKKVMASSTSSISSSSAASVGVSVAAATLGPGRERDETPNSSLPKQQPVMKRIKEMQLLATSKQHSSLSDLNNIPDWKRQLIEKKRNKMLQAS